MERISPSSILRELHSFDKQFWLAYKTLEKLMPIERFNEIKLSLLKSKRVNEKYLQEVDINTYNAELALLDAEWTQKNEEAKQTGIQVHEQIHNLFCTDLHSVKSEFGIDTDTYKVSAQENFLNTDKGIFNELKLEIPLDDEVTLVGIIDCLIKDGNHVKIIDFKATDKIKTDSHYDLSKKKKKTLKFPLSKLSDCDLTHYQLQVSIYAWLCQQLNPDFVIDSLEIWQMKDLKIKKKLPVEYLKDDVEKLMKWEVKSIKMRKEMEKCNLIKY